MGDSLGAKDPMKERKIYCTTSEEDREMKVVGLLLYREPPPWAQAENPKALDS